MQFRLGQVLNAEVDNREEMLQSLNEFASRGIPDLQLLSAVTVSLMLMCYDFANREPVG